MGRPLVRSAALLAAALAGTWVVHGQTLGYGFHYDDYHFVKPYTRAEVLATFSGPWDASGIERAFYRPLTVAFYALRFELFGLNAAACHVASLLMFGCAAALAGRFAARSTGTWLAGLLAVAAFVVHPAMPYAQVVWITNQMHLLASLIVLSALLWWFHVAGRPFVWWLPLVGLSAGAFLVKEDGIVLLPLILVLHAIRRRVLDPVLPPAPRAFIALAAVATIVLMALRHVMLGGLGGYGLPPPGLAVMNFAKGLVRVFCLMPAHAPWLPPATWFAILLPLAALARWRTLSPGIRFLFLAGMAIGVMFNLPFVLVTKKEQLHLVALGSSLLLAASAAVVIQIARGGGARAAATVLVAAGLSACAAIARQAAADFEPFGPMVLSTDRTVLAWTAVPVEIRDYLEQKTARGAASRLSANPVDHLQVVAFGLGPVETSGDGSAYRQVAPPRAEVLVTPSARTIRVRMRALDRSSVRWRIDGRLMDPVFLEPGIWQTQSYSLQRADLRPLHRMHRIRIGTPGVQIGEIAIH